MKQRLARQHHHALRRAVDDLRLVGLDSDDLVREHARFNRCCSSRPRYFKIAAPADRTSPLSWMVDLQEAIRALDDLHGRLDGGGLERDVGDLIDRDSGAISTHSEAWNGTGKNRARSCR